MNRATVKQLAQVREDRAAVSILCPLDRQRPGNTHDPILLRELRDRAVGEIEARLQGRDPAALIARIDEAVGSVDLQHPRDGVAVLVSPDVRHVISLDTPVDPEVVVGERFAIRDLVTAMSRSIRARVVVLSEHKSRCFELRGNEVTERRDAGFPVAIEAPTEADTPHRDFPLDEHEHAEAVKYVFRAVDRAVAALDRRDELPLVVVGAERDLAYFDEVTDRGARIVGRVHGNHVLDTPDQVAHLVRPVLDDYTRRQQQLASAEMREAIGTRAVCGIADTWLAAREGRGHRLVVEDGFRYPARVVDGALAGAPDGTDAFDAVADAVGEVVRHDGEVVGVPSGSLTDLGHIALLTRF